jgi:deoxyribodipyrimidine photolyase
VCLSRQTLGTARGTCVTGVTVPVSVHARLLFSRDLRLTDNPALSAAVAAAPEVVPLFVLDDELLVRTARHASRLAFLHASLSDLDASLRDAGGALAVRRGPGWPG